MVGGIFSAARHPTNDHPHPNVSNLLEESLFVRVDRLQALDLLSGELRGDEVRHGCAQLFRLLNNGLSTINNPLTG